VPRVLVLRARALSLSLSHTPQWAPHDQVPLLFRIAGSKYCLVKQVPCATSNISERGVFILWAPGRNSADGKGGVIYVWHGTGASICISMCICVYASLSVYVHDERTAEVIALSGPRPSARYINSAPRMHKLLHACTRDAAGANPQERTKALELASAIKDRSAPHRNPTPQAPSTAPCTVWLEGSLSHVWQHLPLCHLFGWLLPHSLSLRSTWAGRWHRVHVSYG
jgi:hypothetical protein